MIIHKCDICECEVGNTKNIIFRYEIHKEYELCDKCAEKYDKARKEQQKAEEQLHEEYKTKERELEKEFIEKLK